MWPCTRGYLHDGWCNYYSFVCFDDRMDPVGRTPENTGRSRRADGRPPVSSAVPTHCLSQWQIRYLPAPRYQDQSENVNDIELNILLCIVIGTCHHGIFLLIFIISLLIQCFWSIFRTIMESLLNLSSRSLEDNIQSFGAQTCLDIVSVVSRSRQHKSLLEACNEQILKKVSRACMYLD